MKKVFAQFLIIVAFMVVFSGAVWAAEQSITVNVNVNQATVTQAQSDTVFSLGITSPIFGTASNVYYGQDKFTTKLTGINWLLGYTFRNYLGQGLPANGGQIYFDFGTIAILIPYVGFGYSYRIDNNFTINVGIPEGISFGFTL